MPNVYLALGRFSLGRFILGWSGLLGRLGMFVKLVSSTPPVWCWTFQSMIAAD